MSGKVRGNNGQFIKPQTFEPNTTNITRYLTIIMVGIMVVLVITPMIYHIFIRRNFFLWLVTFLETEFGCTPCASANTTNGGQSSNKINIE